MPRRFKEQQGRKQIARIVKRGLTLLVVFLLAILLAFLFRVGEDVWSFWMIAHQKQIVGIVLLVIILLILLSPIMVEASSNTRTLTGPGKNPKGPRLDE